MRDDGAQDAGEIAPRKGDGGLRAFAVVGFLARQRGGVEGLDDGFEGGELHHRVGDLPAPEGVEAFVEAFNSQSVGVVRVAEKRGKMEGKGS